MHAPELDQAELVDLLLKEGDRLRTVCATLRAEIEAHLAVCPLACVAVQQPAET